MKAILVAANVIDGTDEMAMKPILDKAMNTQRFLDATV